MNSFLPSNIGYVIADVPQDIINKLQAKANSLKSNFTQGQEYNKNLAGNILHEYDISDLKQDCEPFLLDVAKHYKNEFPNYKPRFISAGKIVLKGFWMNFQKKYEFNPVHQHTGLWSFVIWLNVPYSIEDEMAYGPGSKSNNNLAGHFEFSYANILGEHTTLPIPVDKTFNGKICMFPSAMPHAVYPFYTSDDYRITVSGNINFWEQA